LKYLLLDLSDHPGQDVARVNTDRSRRQLHARMTERILVVDDEKLIRWSLRKNLVRSGYQVLEAENGDQALEVLDTEGADLMLLDVRMPGKNGLEVLEHVKRHYPEIAVVLMTAYSSVEGAVDAMKQGAFDYLVKPFNHDEVLLVTQKALETTRMQRELALLRQQHEKQFGIGNLVGNSKKMLEVYDLVHRVAASAATTVLIQGESGTGKDLVAKAIHFTSERASKPFMNITCSALPETLLESELMGHEKGAFTDARERKRGLFEVADGGTVFLNEIGDMGIGLQAKLLRFLEDKVFRRVGGARDMQVNVRIIAATNRNLEQAVREGQFREDLYYRLKVIPLEMPPLRERPEDIELLTAYFVDHFNAELRKSTRGFTAEAIEILKRYRWPGNVRELRNVVERAMILENKEYLGAEDLEPSIRDAGKSDAAGVSPGSLHFTLPEDGIGLQQVEDEMVRQAVERTGGNQTQAAALLQISRDALRYKIKKLGIR
jgi:DNA-binding NtrC family response regulator